MNLNPLAAFRARREQRAQDALSDVMAAFLGGAVSAAGVRVTPDTALASVAVAACIEVRAETFASLPGAVYRKDGSTREALPDHPLARVLFDRPNDLMTSDELWRWKQIREDTAGNAMVRVVTKNGKITEAWPLYNANPTVNVWQGKIAYRYSGDDCTPAGDYGPDTILHFRGPFLKNPLEAASPVDLIRDTIGLTIAADQFFARFLSNGTHFPAYLETDSALTKDDVEALKKQLGTVAGIFSAGGVRIFDRGLKVKQNNMSLKDADLTSQMRWALEQVCRTYRVPLPMVQDWTNGNYSTTEQAGLWLAQHAIAPICVRTERTCKRLFLPGESTSYVKWNIDGLLRGDFTTRMAGYQAGIQAGFLTRAEARALEDMNPLPGLEKPLVPLNMGQIDEDGHIESTTPETEPAPSPEPQGEPDEDEAIPGAPSMTPPDMSATHREVLIPVVEDAIARIRLRAMQDRERGRDTTGTMEWARTTVLPALIESHRRAGVELSADAVIADALADERTQA